MKKSGAKSYALRIDAQLVKPLQELKKQNRRSLNAEINAALETWIQQARSADTAHEDTAQVSPSPASVPAPRAKRKATGKRPASKPAAAATPSVAE